MITLTSYEAGGPPEVIVILYGLQDPLGDGLIVDCAETVGGEKENKH